MGFDERLDMHGPTSVSGSGPAVGVFVTPAQAEAMAYDAEEGGRILTLVCRVGLADPIPPEALSQLSVVVVEVDPSERKSVDRLARLARNHPELPVIAALAMPDIAITRTLVREGVADVIGLPIRGDELTTAALDAQARRALPAVPARLAPLVGVVRTSGGCGATTLATHLAAELARYDWAGKGALLADLDLQFGSVASFLDLPRCGSVPDLIAARDRIDSYLIRSIAGSTTHGLAVLGAPGEINPMDSVAIEGLMAVSEELRRHYGVVVYDFPADWSNWSASVAYSADMILVVVELSLSSLRRARRCLDLFEALAIPPEKIHLVANKVESRMFRPINARDVTETLGREALACLPVDADALRRAQDQGVLVSSVNGRSPYAAAVTKLTETVMQYLGQGGTS